MLGAAMTLWGCGVYPREGGASYGSMITEDGDAMITESGDPMVVE